MYLHATLTSTVITEEADIVLIGTPCQVLGVENGIVIVSVKAYIYPDSIDDEVRKTNNVGTGLLLYVKPEMLEYSHTT